MGGLDISRLKTIFTSEVLLLFSDIVMVAIHAIMDVACGDMAPVDAILMDIISDIISIASTNMLSCWVNSELRRNIPVKICGDPLLGDLPGFPVLPVFVMEQLQALASVSRTLILITESISEFLQIVIKGRRAKVILLKYL